LATAIAAQSTIVGCGYTVGWGDEISSPWRRPPPPPSDRRVCGYGRRRHGDGKKILSENRRLRRRTPSDAATDRLLWVRRRPPSDVVVCCDNFAALADEPSPHIRRIVTAEHGAPPAATAVAAADHFKTSPRMGLRIEMGDLVDFELNTLTEGREATTFPPERPSPRDRGALILINEILGKKGHEQGRNRDHLRMSKAEFIRIWKRTIMLTGEVGTIQQFFVFQYRQDSLLSDHAPCARQDSSRIP
jgi:hypothetical protein